MSSSARVSLPEELGRSSALFDSEYLFEFGTLEMASWAALVYRVWKLRDFEYDFRLKTLKYFDQQGIQKGALLLDVSSVIGPVDESEADGKEFAFEVHGTRNFPNTSDSIERILLIAPSNNLRSQYIAVLQRSLKPAFVLHIDDFFVVESLDNFKIKGSQSLLSYEFAQGQWPTKFAISNISENGWWDYPKACQFLEVHFVAIKEEFNALRAALPATIEQHPNLEGGIWSTYPLMEKGVWNRQVCDMCPLTASMLRELPLCFSSLGRACFSVLSPGSVVTTHSGSTNAKLRIHFALVADSMFAMLRVGDETQSYYPGEALVFDGSFEHSIANVGKDERVVLLVDVWHPQLTETAVSRLEAFFDPKMEAATEEQRLAFPTVGAYKLKDANAPQLKELDYHFHFITVGDPASGKSSFISSFVDRPFSETWVASETIEFADRCVRFQDMTMKIQLWDLPTVTAYYYGLSHGVFICVDVDSPDWLEQATRWHDEITRRAPHAAIVIVGTKCDEMKRRSGSMTTGELNAALCESNSPAPLSSIYNSNSSHNSSTDLNSSSKVDSSYDHNSNADPDSSSKGNAAVDEVSDADPSSAVNTTFDTALDEIAKSASSSEGGDLDLSDLNPAPEETATAGAGATAAEAATEVVHDHNGESNSVEQQPPAAPLLPPLSLPSTSPLSPQPTSSSSSSSSPSSPSAAADAVAAAVVAVATVVTGKCADDATSAVSCESKVPFAKRGGGGGEVGSEGGGEVDVENEETSSEDLSGRSRGDIIEDRLQVPYVECSARFSCGIDFCVAKLIDSVIKYSTKKRLR